VRAVVERVGGRVSVASERGRGALFRLTLPFSMMVTSVMTLESCGQLFGAPLDAVVATLRVPRERIHAIGSIEAFAYRDQTVPLVDLAQVLGRSRDRVKGPDALVLVASVSGQLGAVEVDSVGERMDVILRPIEGLLSGVAGIAGTTLTGDGEVLVVLDLPDLLA
jgi:two-component system, chemotaxis family, sensor kinase CheA